MKISDRVISEFLKLLSEQGYPLGAKNDPSAPWNQPDTRVRAGISPESDKYKVLWWGKNADLAFVADKNNALYVLKTDIIPESELEVYADREEVDRYRDEDGVEQVDLGDWEINEDVIGRYLNGSSDIMVGSGSEDYSDETHQLVKVDDELKKELNHLGEFITNNKSQFLDILNSTPLLESVDVDSVVSELERRIEMAMDFSNLRVSAHDLNDISVELGIDIDSPEFQQAYSSVVSKAITSREEELDADVDYVSREYFDGGFPDSFSEFYAKFKEQQFDNKYSADEVLPVFNKLTKDPNQLSLFEGIRDREVFRKVSFGEDVAKLEPHDRMMLIGLIKKFSADKIKTDTDGKWHTFVPEVDVDKFERMASYFSPSVEKDTVKKSRFRERTKELKGGDKITFLDYKASETNPPVAVGFLKSGFINPDKSLLKYPGGEMWIKNSNVDANYFYHRELGEVTPEYIKVYIMADIDNATSEDKNRLKDIIKKYGGTYRNVFGRKASGEQRFTLIPPDNFDEFYAEASEFEPYEGEMETDIVSEGIKVVRAMIREALKK